jgi:protein kinase C-binding protein 1
LQYPYWPAKVMSIDVEKQQADVRFFGAHDRAYIPSHHCIIFCEKDPNKSGKGTPTNNKKGIVEALKETEEYISNIRASYGFE